MKIKYSILLLFMLLLNTQLFAGEGRFHIYGRCTLVSQEVLEGFISFEDDNLWISQFSSQKLENPYAVLFSNNNQVVFGEDKRDRPGIHSFTCRYNDLKQLRPIANNRLEVTIKGNRSIDVSYKFRVRPIIYFTDGTSKKLDWEDIVSINFMSSPDVAPKTYDRLYVGSVKSTQGVYFGIIDGCDYYQSKGAPIKFTKNGKQSLTIDDVDMLECEFGEQVIVREGKNTGVYGIDKPWNRVRINLPTIGTIDVPWRELESITRSDSKQLAGATYDSSPTPKRLVGTLTLRKGEEFRGPMAYDLDEAMNIEFLDGANNGFTYCLQLDAVESIEPRNYKYSLITLKNGGRLSLGDYQDVTNLNNGVLMLNSSTYIPWNEIMLIQFEQE